MIYQINNLNKVASLLLATLFFGISYSQEAEKIYHEEYSKLSFVFQPSMLYGGSAWNRDHTKPSSMEFTGDFSFQFGVYYNFAQSGSFNFKTGLIAREFVPKFNLNISDEDIGYNDDFLTDYELENQFIISIPIKTEYYLKLAKKMNLSLGADLNLNLVTGSNYETYTSIAVDDGNGNLKDIFYAHSDFRENIILSTELSLGLHYKAKFALIELSYYLTHLSGPNYTYGDYRIVNLEQSPDEYGRYVIYNNFRGFSLVVSPKKGWLKKK